MTVLFNPPFTSDTYEKFISVMSTAINHYESLSIVNLAKRDQLYRIQQIKNNQYAFKKFCIDYKEITFLYLDLAAEMIEDQVDLDSYFQKSIIKHNGIYVIYVIDSDRLLDERPYLISQLDAITHTKYRVSLIYLFQKNISTQFARQSILPSSTMLQNVYIYPLYDKKDCIQYLSQLEQRFKIQLPKDIAIQILNQCGGYYWLIKQAVREYSLTKKVNSIFSNEAMQFRLRTIYNEFSEYEKTILQDIIKDKFEISNDNKFYLDYFIQARYLAKKNRRYIFTVPLIEKYIQDNMGATIVIRVNKKNQIEVNGVAVPGYFSQNEHRLLVLFLSKNNVLLKREECASIIWGQEYQELYTDWALDQIIRRLRKKLLKIGVANNVITTKRNQGYIFCHRQA